MKRKKRKRWCIEELFFFCLPIIPFLNHLSPHPPPPPPPPPLKEQSDEEDILYFIQTVSLTIEDNVTPTNDLVRPSVCVRNNSC